ncbi:hypothetical protein [Candidatus Nanohalobium constans]|uniref:DUF4231 domain-containing protein n=1 Tax=Candidatus Nanohalobium constans TaxID=2565781 RepID=A0A5Q0UHX1_9ARCH|nr:hypothetical protein [Candidatus Nanohalobium constans]QGA80790.1 hypothetical protein LC1Nh_0908 [Candidatus Nanohalobium constans]
MKNKIFRLTPLGRADGQIRDFLENKLEDHQFERYNKALMKYRNFKLIQQFIRILFYASIITSVAATFNLNLSLINQIASYLGFTVILIIYGIVNYLTMIYREEYHVQRDILIATASENR